jgi:hypothetical protein
MLHVLAALARLQGNSDQAAAHCREALGLYREVGFRQGIAACLSELAALLGASGQPERATRIFGAAAALRDTTAAHFPSSDRIDYDAEITSVRDQLDEAVFSAAWSEGRSAPVDDVLAGAGCRSDYQPLEEGMRLGSGRTHATPADAPHQRGRLL